MNDVIENDALHGMIVERLAARQRMLKQMDEWERRKQKKQPQRLTVRIGLAVAACAACLLIMWPMLRPSEVSPLDELGIGVTMPAYRAADPELPQVEKLIEEQNYAAALELALQMLDESDTRATYLDCMAEKDEEMEYEWQQEMVYNSEVRWVCIWLLTRTEQWSKARRELKKYLKNTRFCEHEAEARLLLEALK